MNPKLRLILVLISALAGSALVRAQTNPPPPQVTPTTPSTPVASPVTQSTAFAAASAAVTATVQQATSIADGIRQGVITSTVPAHAELATAVTTANNAIVAEDKTTRSTALSQRQATLIRLRTAASEAERQHLIEDLRVQSGQRLEEQREAARLVRDRLRVLRDLTTTTRPAGN